MHRSLIRQLLFIKPYAAVYFLLVIRCLIKSSAVAESENPPGALGCCGSGSTWAVFWKASRIAAFTVCMPLQYRSSSKFAMNEHKSLMSG